MIKKIIAAVLVSTLSVSVFAANHLIFSCTNNQGKKVEVKEIGQNIQYSFGRPGNPELVFKNSKTQALQLTKDYGAIGQGARFIVLQNGSFSYIPYARLVNKYEKYEKGEHSEYGVRVKKNGSPVSEIKCNIRKQFPIINIDDDFIY